MTEEFKKWFEETYGPKQMKLNGLAATWCWEAWKAEKASAARPSTARLYYEAHVTIEPVFGDRLFYARVIAEKHKFKVADLLMKKREEDTEERSKKDTFITGHGKQFEDIVSRLNALVAELRAEGYKVWRYKIEDTLLDSRHDGDRTGSLAKSGLSGVNPKSVIVDEWGKIEDQTITKVAKVDYSNETDWPMERLQRKCNQAWDMAGLARKDRDQADEKRHTQEARDMSAEISKRLAR